MLAALLVQYTLFAVVCLSTLSHTPESVSIETHIFNSSVTLLFAAAYVLVSTALYHLYHIITRRSSNMNPDLEMVYANVEDELRDLDPDADIEDPAREVCEKCDPTPPTPHGDRLSAALLHHRARPESPPSSPPTDGDHLFYLEVYGYGLVIFVIYYSVDMVLLAPALSLLTGLMVLSVYDALMLLRNPTAFPEPFVTSRLVSFIAMVLLFISLTEMFVASSHKINDVVLSEISSSSPMYIFLTYVLPLLACLLLSMMPRDCSDQRKIRRATPLAVLLALFVVLWVLGMDIVVSQRDYYRGAMKKIDSDWHSMADALFMLNGTRRSGWHEPAYYLDSPVPAEHRDIPLISILLEPLLKLALTFSVITGIVNQKATDTAAIVAFLTAAKELHFSRTAFAGDHLLRSCIISGCAAFLCSLRYIPVVQSWLRNNV